MTDFDALLDDLTEEELKALNEELEDEYIPSSEKKREEQRPRMYEKSATVNTLEQIIKRNKIGELPSPKKLTTSTNKPSTWKKPDAVNNYGNVTVTKNIDTNNNDVNNKIINDKFANQKNQEDTKVKDEMDLLLEGLTEEEILELAVLTDAHSLLTQDETHSLEQVSVPDRRLMSMSDDNADLDSTLLMECLKNDSEELFHVRINNVKLEPDILHAIFDSLSTTKHMKHLSLAGIHMKDEDGLLLNEAISKNKTLETLNLESNELTNLCIEPLCGIFQTHATIREFKCSHQKHGLGSRGEEAMARALDKNNQLLKISYPFKVQSPRSLADRCQIRNNEILRQKRSKGEDFYNYKEEIKKRDEHPQPWIKEKGEDKNEKMKADLADQKGRMKKVPGVDKMRAEAKMRAKENAKPTMDNELANKLAAARKSRGRSIK